MKSIITYILILCAAGCFAQNNNRIINKGNKAFEGKNYIAAETDYRQSASNAPATAPAAYNLGNAIYRQNLPGEAKFAYLKAIENAKTKKQKHLAYHNLGNSFMQEKNYQAAVESYKNALRNNPADEQTRYNFALAKKMLKDNPPPPPPKDDKKDDKNKDKEQNKDQGGGGNDKDKGDKGDQKDKGDQGKQDNQKDKGSDGKDKQDKGEGDKDKQPAGPSPSKQRMENLLDAMNNEEKKIQDKINAQKVKAQPKRQEKDW